MLSIRENRNFFTTIIASFVLLSIVMICGGRLIFENSLDAIHARARSEISHAGEVVKIFFSGLEHDLFFLRNRKTIKNYADSDFKSVAYKKKAHDALLEYERSYKYIYRIEIADRSGNKMLGTDDMKTGPAAPAHAGHGKKEEKKRFSGNNSELREGQAYISIITADTKGTLLSSPVGRIVTPVYGSDGDEKGFLVVEMNLSSVFDLLPPGMFIQNNEGYSLYKETNGTVGFRKSNHSFSGKKGELVLPDGKTVYYTSIEVFPGENLIITMDETADEQRLFIVKLVLAALFIFALYFCLILAVSYMNIKNHRALEATQKAIIFSLVNLVEFRDPETGYHLERTRNYGLILAGQLSRNEKHKKTITDKFIENLYNASPLHDIGKVGIRDSVLLKAGRLTDSEFAEMKEHVIIGRDILHKVTENLKHNEHFLLMSRNIAAYHHEKFDGTGYPEQLKGDRIPLEARIYALCDAYDAIRAKRPYKEPSSHKEAVAKISSESGRHFDPDIVDAFMKCDGEFNEIYETYKLFVEQYIAISDFADYKELRVKWMPDLSTGVDKIDAQHMELIDYINNLLKAIIKGRGREEVLRTIKFLEEYSIFHFGEEEKYMLQHDYAGYADHRAEHLAFIDRLNAIKSDYEKLGEDSEAVISLNKHVIEWLIKHITMSDKSFGKFLMKDSIASKNGPAPNA